MTGLWALFALQATVGPRPTCSHTMARIPGTGDAKRYLLKMAQHGKHRFGIAGCTESDPLGAAANWGGMWCLRLPCLGLNRQVLNQERLWDISLATWPSWDQGLRLSLEGLVSFNITGDRVVEVWTTKVVWQQRKTTEDAKMPWSERTP